MSRILPFAITCVLLGQVGCGDAYQPEHHALGAEGTTEPVGHPGADSTAALTLTSSKGSDCSCPLNNPEFNPCDKVNLTCEQRSCARRRDVEEVPTCSDNFTGKYCGCLIHGSRWINHWSERACDTAVFGVKLYKRAEGDPQLGSSNLVVADCVAE